MLSTLATLSFALTLQTLGADVVQKGKLLDLEFEGNLIFQDEVYEVLLDADRRVLRSKPDRLAEKVQNFLGRAGFTLANVRAETSSTTVKLVIDEGVLDRIVIPRENGFLALAVQLAIDLPNNVFNQPLFNSQIKRLQEKFGVKISRYEIKRLEEKPESRFESQVLSELAGLSTARGNWELVLEVDHSERSDGLFFELGYKSPAGFIAGVGYRWWSLLIRNDELRLRGHVGLRLQDIAQESEGRRFVSRGFVGADYHSGPMVAKAVGFDLWANGYVENRERRDLNIDAYDILLGDFGGGLSARPRGGVDFHLGGGVEQLRLLSNLSTIVAPPRRDPNEGWRPYTELRVELDVTHNHGVLKAARRHDVELDAKWYPRDRFVTSSLKYKKGWAFDWDRFDLGVSLYGQFGNVPFIDEVSAGKDLVAVFGAETFTNKSATVHLEYRLSLIRDLLGISLFHGATVFEEQLRFTDSTKLAFANSFGPAVHGLLYDAIEMSISFAAGFMTGGRQDVAVALALRQAF